jgi:hypothetical protein
MAQSDEECIQLLDTMSKRALVRDQCIEGTEAATNYVRGVFDAQRFISSKGKYSMFIFYRAAIDSFYSSER